MKPSAARVLAALQRGERISIHDSKRLSCGAIGQRISELRRLGIDIRDDWGRVKGEKQAWKVWWIEGTKPQPQPRTHTIVTEHVRRLPDIINREAEEVQGSLFA